MAEIRANSSKSILIAYLRKNGGSAKVNCSELGRENRFHVSAIGYALTKLEKKGLVTVERNTCGAPFTVTIDEVAMRQYNEGNFKATPTANAKIQKRRSGGGIFGEVCRLLKSLREHQFKDSSLVQPLFDAAKFLSTELESLFSDLETMRLENTKLIEAISALGSTEQEIQEAQKMDAEEIAGAVDYDTLMSYVTPTIDFARLLDEPTSIFRPLARLQVKTKESRNLIIELARELAKQKLLRARVDKLLEEKQKANQETLTSQLELRTAFEDWRRMGERVIASQVQQGVAVVSTRE